MSEEYKQTLLTYLPILGINAVLIPLFTVRTRLINNIVSQPCDKQTNGGSSSLFKLLFFVTSQSKKSEEERKAATQVMIDLQRNFIESITPFGILALGIATLISNPSSTAILAVKTFVISRTIHNFLFVFYPYQPFRAMSFMPQVASTILLIYEYFLHQK